MGQLLHGSARTTQVVRRSVQRSQETLDALAGRHGIDRKTVSKWRKRTTVEDAPMGPKTPRSTVLSVEEEATVVAFRRHTLLPLDDCLYALQPTIPHLTRSSLHRCLQRHGISRLPEVEGDKPKRQAFKQYPIGYVHVDFAEVRTRPAEAGGSRPRLRSRTDDRSRRQRRADPQRGGVCEALWGVPGPGFVGPNDGPAPSEPRGQPEGQRSAPPDRHRAAGVARADAGLHGAADGRGADEKDVVRCLKRYMVREVFRLLPRQVEQAAEKTAVGA